MNSFISYPEMPLTLFKGNANRVENEMNSFISYPEMPLTLLFKGNHSPLAELIQCILNPTDLG